MDNQQDNGDRGLRRLFEECGVSDVDAAIARWHEETNRRIHAMDAERSARLSPAERQAGPKPSCPDLSLGGGRAEELATLTGDVAKLRTHLLATESRTASNNGLWASALVKVEEQIGELQRSVHGMNEGFTGLIESRSTRAVEALLYLLTFVGGGVAVVGIAALAQLMQ